MKLLLLIPAYNEGENIARVVNSIIQDFPQYDYIIINDGSTDNTEKICKDNHFDYISLFDNTGLAGAFKAGMKYAQNKEYDYVIQFDGDGQHNAAFIGEMLKKAEKDGLDIVIGSRFVTEKKPLSARMLGNNLIQATLKVTTGKTIRDTTSGMRLYNKKTVNLLSKDYDLGPEPDTIAYLMRSGAKVGEVQVTMSERIAGKSYLSFTKSIQYMFRICMSILFVQWFRKIICFDKEEN